MLALLGPAVQADPYVTHSLPREGSDPGRSETIPILPPVPDTRRSRLPEMDELGYVAGRSTFQPDLAGELPRVGVGDGSWFPSPVDLFSESRRGPTLARRGVEDRKVSIPEPAALVLLLTGRLGLAARRHLRRMLG